MLKEILFLIQFNFSYDRDEDYQKTLFSSGSLLSTVNIKLIRVFETPVCGFTA